MALDTYGLPEEQYLEIFKDKSLFVLKAFAAMLSVADENDIKLKVFTDKFLWDMFQEIAYSTDEEARLTQKELDPEEVKKRQYDSIIVPSREDLMEEIKSVNAKIEALTDYISVFIQGHNQ